jgi:hypothetical protein
MLFHQQLLEGTLNRSKKHIRKCSDSFSVAAEEEEILDKEEFTEKGRVYYQYELLTPFAETGLHNIAKITTSQNYVIMASISASEAQWSANEKDLRRVLSSFHIDES